MLVLCFFQPFCVACFGSLVCFRLNRQVYLDSLVGPVRSSWFGLCGLGWCDVLICTIRVPCIG